MPRLLLYIIAVPLVLIIAAAILVPLLLDEEKILALAASQVKQQTGATLSVTGASSISLLPRLGVSLEQVSLTMPDETQGAIQAAALNIGVQVLPLLRGNVAIDNIALRGVVARIVTEPAEPPVDTTTMSKAELEAFYARRQAKRDKDGAAAGADAALAVPLALEVASLSITDSRLEIGEAGSEPDVITIVALKGKHLNLDGRPMPLQATLVLPGEPPVEIDLDGTVTLSQQTQKLGITELAVTATGVLESAIKLSTSGEVDISRQIADLQLLADIGSARAEGQLRYASHESPQIDATLQLNQFTPALLALAGPDAAASEPAGGVDAGDGEAEDVTLPLNALRAMDTRATLNIDEVLWGAHRVTGLEAKLRVVDGAAILPRVTGTVHGGKLSMKANLNARQPVARLNTQGSLEGVDISAALAAAEVDPILAGTASLTWKLHGQGNTSNRLVNTLRGPIDLQTENAVLQDMGVEKMLCEAVALVNQEALSSEFPEDSAFEALSVNIEMGQGKATLKPLRAKLADMRLLGKGALDINSMDFDVTFTAKLLPGLAKRDPACRVNERIMAIDWPVSCKGNVTGEPGDWCAVDSGDIVEDLAEYELKRKAQKEVEEKFGEEAGEVLKKLLGN
ncbi:AsmA family protein [Pseudohalioglobus sediminis]|uniref:AsmA family protein n=1 Tax=Pseudohalioglobus sediminis TaxID=2606449 RepID=A0A5B0WSL7_9GAMM|nr:AsmA family protein [Pseudohalioglobus sediminis]KAA1189478.1 AsmA family protein [Pseudohalioglobus sediminis]